MSVSAVLAMRTSVAKLARWIIRLLKKALPFQINSRTAVIRIASTTASRRALKTPGRLACAFECAALRTGWKYSGNA